MKQDEKRCETCVYSNPDRGECQRNPPIFAGMPWQNLPTEPCWLSPYWPDSQWCGKGLWRDEHGNLVAWEDPEETPTFGTGIIEEALKEINAHLDKLPHPIHWIRIEDKKPALADAGKEFFVSAMFCNERVYSVKRWKGDRWMGTPFVTHWAHITKPEV